MRKVVYAELGQARRQVLHQRVRAKLQLDGVKTYELASQMVLA
jgi:hypothetical protein